MNNSQYHVEIINLKKNFGYLQVLKDLSLNLEKGKLLTLFGPNGSGKTTLLNILSTLIKPTSGEFNVAGYNSNNDPALIRTVTEYIANDYYLYPNLTAIENMLLVGELNNVRDCREKAKELLKEFNLDNRKNDLVRTYSSGMKKRLTIARSLLSDAEVIFMDEPFNTLDQIGIELLFSVLEKLKADSVTTIITTHSFNEGFKFSDKIAILDKGKIVFEKDRNELDFESFQDNYTSIISQ